MPAFEASRPISSSILPRPQPVTYRIVASEFILIFRGANYKRRPCSKPRFIPDRVVSVAAMQEQERNLPQIVVRRRIRSIFRRQKKHRPSFVVSSYRPPKPVDRFQSACKMQYDYGDRASEPPDARAEVMRWRPPIPRWRIPTKKFSSVRGNSRHG